MRRSLRIFIILAVMATFATGAYAFTAATSVPATNAGYGEGAITGSGVNDVQYTVDENAGPPTITKVSFYFDPAINGSATVMARIVSTGNWYTCTVAAGPGSGYYGCPITGTVTVTDADNLEVLVYD